ncbi:Gfo/Idh/MocA family protein [Haloglomus litoreum]|uniref:Gfo/Idh/MocA family protein n=1 Tax=Haloglomus litoreum TaxID=3034026 RepID=UPI0023E79C2F|nr:Gfo/Idh/MocA family oxidoreductase [Haloglomus sp. DT116]
MADPVLRAGVLGVGTMGRHHARIYRELPGAELVGVGDADETRAASVADEYGTEPMAQADLLADVDVVSIAVPTRFHDDLVEAAIDRGVHVLVEKPFVEDPLRGRDLIRRARERGVTLAVGHVERYNPAVRALDEIVPELDIIAIETNRLGPPLDRDIHEDVVLDLMIHDIDVILSLLDAKLTDLSARGTQDGQYVTATLEFGDGTVASLTASRVTQEKIRTLSITARECKVNVDYGDRTVDIHRHSLPEYVVSDGDVRYRHESIVERPTVDNGEPLKAELESFLAAVRDGTRPLVDGEAGLRALELARTISATAAGEPTSEGPQ